MVVPTGATASTTQMPVTFYVPGRLRNFTGGSDKVELDFAPETVGHALEALWALHPGIRDRLVTEQGELRQHINVFVADENIRFTGGLATRLTDGAELTIIPAVSGG